MKPIAYTHDRQRGSTVVWFVEISPIAWGLVWPEPGGARADGIAGTVYDSIDEAWRDFMILSRA